MLGEFTIWHLIAFIIMSPLAFIGIFIIFKKIVYLILVRRGHVKSIFFTLNRGIRTNFARPKNNSIIDGKKMFKFTPKKIFRWGSTPTQFYTENSIEPIDPLNEKKSDMSPEQLDAMQTLWYSDGASDAIKKQNVLKIIAIITLIAAIAAASMSVMLWQSQTAMEGNLGSRITTLSEKVDNIPQNSVSTIPETTEEMPVIS